MHILVVEDNRRLADSLKQALKERAYAVDAFYNGEDGLHAATTEPYDLVILDIMLPKYDGLEILHAMREKKIKTPVLFLTAKDTVEDRIAGLDAGADDYLVKPFALGELIARVKALLRRAKGGGLGVLKVGDLTLDLEKREATRGGKTEQLSAKEFALLEFFMVNVDKILPRSTIAEHVWDMNFNGISNVVDVYVNYLRNKIDHGFDKKLIHTVRGTGYVMRTPE